MQSCSQGRPPTFWLGDTKVNVSPLIAHLVKLLGHIFHLDKLDYCISGVSMHCFPHMYYQNSISFQLQGLCPWTPLGAPPSDPHRSEEIAATAWKHVFVWIFINIIQMMHGNECDIQIWWIRCWNFARGRSPSATFLTERHIFECRTNDRALSVKLKIWFYSKFLTSITNLAHGVAFV